MGKANLRELSNTELLERLGFTKDMAYRRMQATRAAAKHPEVLGHLQSGELVAELVAQPVAAAATMTPVAGGKVRAGGGRRGGGGHRERGGIGPAYRP